MLADYGSTGVTLREHPLELMRPGLPGDLLTSTELESGRHGRRVRVAGLVVARQRPATAKGVTFMLLEDERGTINLIVPPPIHDRYRLAVRAEPLVLATGRLERRDGTINVLVDRIERLERPDLPAAKVTHIEPRRAWSTEESRAAEHQRGAGGVSPRMASLEADLRAVAPAGHSLRAARALGSLAMRRLTLLPRAPGPPRERAGGGVRPAARVHASPARRSFPRG